MITNNSDYTLIAHHRLYFEFNRIMPRLEAVSYLDSTRIYKY